MKKKGERVLYLIFVIFLLMFSISLISAYNWVKDGNMTSTDAFSYAFKDNDKPDGIVVYNSIADKLTQRYASIKYVQYNGNVQTIQALNGAVRRETKWCGVLGGGFKSRAIYEYPVFVNPSLIINGSTKIVTYTEYWIDRDLNCDDAPNADDEYSANLGVRNSNFKFHVAKTDGSQWTIDYPTGPTDPCLTDYNTTSVQQRASIDKQGRLHFVYKRSTDGGIENVDDLAATFNGCSYELGLYQSNPTDNNWKNVLKTNFNQKFSWGGKEGVAGGTGIEYCLYAGTEPSSQKLGCSNYVWGQFNAIPIIVTDDINRAWLIYIKKAAVGYDINYLVLQYNPPYGIQMVDSGLIYHLATTEVPESLAAVMNVNQRSFPGGAPEITYYDPVNDEVWLIYYSGTQWQRSLVQSGSFSTHVKPGWRSPDIVLDENGITHIAYSVQDGVLKYGYANAQKQFTGATRETVADTGTNHPIFLHMGNATFPEVVTNGKFYHPNTVFPQSNGTSGGGLEDCSDGIDNDGDSLIDCLDVLDCSAAPNCQVTFQCNDGIDNDADNLTDYPADYGCDSANDPNETDVPVLNCGNSQVDPGETCDGTNFNGLTCSDFDSFTGGNVVCNPVTCQISTSSCTGGTTGSCGDGTVNTGETCDGTNFNGLTCSDFDSFTGGSLSCDSGLCLIDTGACTGGTGPTCGNSLCELGETTVNCPQDCDINSCGDGVCDLSENPVVCPNDCDLVNCGNNICEDSENQAICPQDCVIIIGEISCAQYTSESSCNGAILTQEINNTIEAMNPQFQSGFCGDPALTFTPDDEGASYSPETCGSYLSCKCKWFVDNANPDGVCDGITKFKINNPTSCTSNELTDYFCRTSGEGDIGSCIAGNEYTLTWTAQAYDSDENPLPEPVEWCQSGSKNFPCPSSSKIPFFTAINVIIALIFIGVIYYIISNKRRSSKPVKNHKKK